MRIYKDIFNGDEMFSDSYPIMLVHGVMYEVTGKYVSRKAGEVILAGANPSAEEADEGAEDALESGCDIVLANRLVENFGFATKKHYLAYLKEYMNRVFAKLNETNPEEVSTFKSKMNEVVKTLMGRFKELQFFTGESMDVDGMIALMEYRDIDGESRPVMMFFKHGLVEEKC